MSRKLKWALVLVLAALVVGKLFVVDRSQIPQNGMFPGLPAGSTVFGLRTPFASPERFGRGDIVVFAGPPEGGSRYRYIWRVVALPGDTVECRGESLVINGQPLARERLRDEQGATIYRERNGDAAYEIAFNHVQRKVAPDVSITVPAGQLFLMGDNRHDAFDCRYFGPVEFRHVIARKLF